MSPTKAPLDEATQELAYVTLAQLFDKYHRTQAQGSLTTEILPPGIESPNGELVLEDETERSIGIPKKVLVAAFLHARRIFSARGQDVFNDEDALAATRVILLFDPEYLTAANYRKRYLLSLSQLAAKLSPAVKSELWFLDCILTSPLHRHSKSPTLWYHRSWLYHTYVSQCQFLFASKSSLMVELGTILKAAEQHQHNYYAFQYARRILHTGVNTVMKRDEVRTNRDEIFLNRAILDEILRWCKAHPSDTSGWSFIAFWMEPAYANSASLRATESTLKFAVDMQWRGQALWHFLRTLAGLADINRKEDLDDMALQIRNAMLELSPFPDRSSAPSDRAPSG